MATQTGSIDLKAAKSANDEASKVATNYLAVDTSGIMVYDGTNGTQTPSNPDADTNNVFIDDDSLDIRKGTTVLATFGADGSQIGQTGESHLEMDYHSMQFKDGDGISYFYVSDLLDLEGYITDTFTANGTQTQFVYSVAASGRGNYIKSVTIDDVRAHNYSATVNSLTFDTAPSANSIVKITYEPSITDAKAYTLGTRKSNNPVGVYSLAEGKNNIALGEASHAEGRSNQANALCSHVEGANNTASANYAHVEGWMNTCGAAGLAAHAEGRLTTANGQGAHAQNSGTIAESNNQTALGKYNIADSDDIYAVIVGNGTANNARSNALTVDWSGNVVASGDITDGSGNVLSDKIEASDVPTNETDPTVPSWAKASTKPSYSANEITGLIDFFYPVGSYYETSDESFDPNTSWGGTWVKDSAGKITVAQDTSDTAFDTIGETGGAKTSATGDHTLTAAECGIRAHGHGMSHNHSHNHASSGGSNDYFLTSDETIYRRSIKPGTNTAVTNNFYGAGTIVRRQVTDTDSTGASKTTTDQNTASNATSAHNHGSVSTLQPYVVVNRWHRTA